MIPYPEIQPYLFKIGPFQLRWYGLMYLFGFAASYLLVRRHVRRENLGLSDETIISLYTWGIMGLLLGARLGYVIFYNAAYYLGVCQMEQGRYEAAIKAFDEVLNLFPKADKMTPAYYKKGLALLQVQRNAEAIETFKKLLTRFPESSEALLSKDELQKLGIDPEELVNTDSGL